MSVIKHGKCPLCRSAYTTMLNAKGEVVVNTLSSRTRVAGHVVWMASPVFVAVSTGLALRAAASGSAGSAGNAGNAGNAGEVDLALACSVSLKSHLARYGVFLLLTAPQFLWSHKAVGWTINLFACLYCVIDLLAAVMVCCTLLRDYVILSLDDPPGTPPAKRTPAWSRRRWNAVIYSVNSVAQAIIIWAIMFHFKIERFQGRPQYEDPYGVAFVGALVTGLLRIPTDILIFPDMFPHLFSVNA
jgi:hypothetical protein